MLNEAALLTARTDKKLIDDEALDEAIDRVIAGPQKRTRIMTAKERKITAYHEGGHALVAAAMNHTDPVTKVTILPRGRALGYTMVMPTDDKYSTTRNEMLDQLAYALGGRVAEEIVFHDPTTGAANDIEKATAIARKMVTEYGMSERVGAVKLGQSQGEVFLGRDMGHQRDYSEQVAARRRRGGAQAHRGRARRGLARRQRQPRRPRPARARAAREGDAQRRRARRDVQGHRQAAGARPTWLSSEHRTLSDLPPVLTPAEQAALNGRSNGSGAPAGLHGDPGRPPHRRPRSTRPPRPGADPAGERAPADPGHRGAGRWPCRPLTEDVDDATMRGPVDLARAEAAVRELLIAIGEDPDREGLRDTPGRVARAARELYAGLWQDPAEVLSKTFSIDHEELIIVRDIPMYSTCEHHLLPFHGVAHIGYIPAPDGKVTGLSKLGRLVEVFARRPQVQEQITTQIADALVEHLRRAGRHRRHRGRAPVHVDARRAEAGLAHHHLGRARPAARPRHPCRGDVAAARRQAVTGR